MSHPEDIFMTAMSNSSVKCTLYGDKSANDAMKLSFYSKEQSGNDRPQKLLAQILTDV